MEFVIDPPIATKILKMEQRVRWREAAIVQRGIDQTRLVLDDGQDDNPDFSFLVMGDTGSGAHRGHNPQRRIAEQMLEHRDDCRFVLHTGDVIYLTGSSAYYPPNFIEPYREFLVGGNDYKHIAYDRMVFNLPFLPTLGNHDYYDMPLLYGVLSQLTLPLRQLLQSRLDLDVSWRGSRQGNAYAKAFLDYLKALNPADLDRHLDQHYTAKTEIGRCLRYEPGRFTRLPNRYYTFRSNGIDFFALDSNTFNAPIPLPDTLAGEQRRRHLEQQRTELDNQMQEILLTLSKLNPDDPDDAERMDDLQAKLEQLAEVKKDINKQLESNKATTETDLTQLEWLQQRLIESWHTESVRGRVLFFHHPPYVTEATKWHQAQTLAVRYRLRQVLDEVATAVSDRAQGRAIVDLVLNGHAHCLEHLCTMETGHADANTNWIVCGGSGFSLRRQREEGADVRERFGQTGVEEERLVARSQFFIGRSGQGAHRRRPYSFIRIDVKAGSPPKFLVRPYVAERYQKEWFDRAVDPFIVG